MLPAHAADIGEILSFMPRVALNNLSHLGQLRDGLHARTEQQSSATQRKRKTAPRNVG